MSYVVALKLATYMPSWFSNAWSPIYEHRDKGEVRDLYSQIAAWNKTYNNVIAVEQPDSGWVWTITFPTEQDYTWFVLKWS